MGRRRKEGKRDVGIQARGGYLYILVMEPGLQDGKKVTRQCWKATHLTDTPEHLKTVRKMREHMVARNNKKGPKTDILLEDYITMYFLPRKESEVATTTYATYTYQSRYVIQMIGKTKVRDVDEDLVRLFLDALYTERKLQPRTASDVRAFLRHVLTMAQSDGLLVANPVPNVQLDKALGAHNKKDKYEDETFFNAEEAKKFLQYCKETGNKLYELFYFTLSLGLRREEVLGIRWSAINFERKTLEINHTVTKGIAGVNRLNETKTASSCRVYALSDKDIELLKGIKVREMENRSLFGKGYVYPEYEYVFRHENGELYHPDTITKAMRKVLKQLPELPQKVTFHGLRTSCVSILVQKGHDINEIAKFVGHADVETTLNIYTKCRGRETSLKLTSSMNELLE